MNIDGPKLRDALGRHLDDLRPSTPVETIRKRARWGRLLTATSVVTLIAVVGASGAFMLERFADDETGRVVGPGPETHDGLIAFTTQDRGEPMPWVAIVPASGVEVTRLHEGSNPSWSPDGTRIAFSCYPGICTMNVDGSDVVQLTSPEEPIIDEDPNWGPGGFIAFTRTPTDGSRDIFIVRQEGGRPIPLIQDEANHAASWSPDGSAIAFVRGIGPLLEAPPGGVQLWTMNADGSELVQLTENGAERPDWSPDGNTIVFDQASAIWTIPAEGGEPRKMEPATTGEHPDTGAFPTWSPDSERIAYTCEARGFGHHDLCVMNADGTGRTAILATPANEAFPAWQPIVPDEEISDGATFGRYIFRYGEGFNRQGEPIENTGIVEINASQGSLCVESHEIRGSSSAHLHRKDDPAATITIFEPPKPYRPTMCAPDLDPAALQAVIDDPTSYYIEFHHENSGGTFTAPLKIMSDLSQPSRCHVGDSYGETIPGRWLEDLIVEIAAPGGYEVTKEEVKDTGTALRIGIPEYNNDPTIYATMLTPGDDPNITSSPPQEEVGEQGSFTLYLQEGNPWQSYKAVGDIWQLSLIAYPAADNDQVEWPVDTLDWLRRAAEIAEAGPPRCSGPTG